MLNARGQAYSTFKLLIAAIVAIAILTILFSIIGVIPSMGQTDPADAAATKLKDAAAGSLATELVSNKVVFKDGMTLNSISIVEKSGVALTKEQVCLILGDFSGDDIDDVEGRAGFNYASDNSLGKSISYHGGDKEARIAVLCYKGLGGVAEVIDQGGRVSKALNFEDEDADDIADELGSVCSDIGGKACTVNSTETCCVVVLLGS